MSARDIEIAKTLLKRPVAFHWALAMICESVNAGLMLSQAIYWSERTDDADGWFYKTRVDWFNELCIGKESQITARKILRARGFIKEDLRGNPPKSYYQVQIEKVYKAVAQLSAKQTIKSRETRQSIVGKPDNRETRQSGNQTIGKPDNQVSGNQTTLLSGNQTNIEEQRLPETTSETTEESTAAGAAIPFLEIWNSNCGSLPKVREMTKSRERRLKSRLKTKPNFAQEFTEAVKKAAINPFLSGDNNRSWVASFDWLIANDTNHVAVLEGKYDAKHQGNRGAANQGTGRKGGAFGSGDTSRFKREADITVM